QAQFIDTDTESDPEEAPLEAEESQPLGSRVPLMSEEFEASEPLDTRTVSSHSPVSSDSNTPLSPAHPLTHVSPTHTPTRVLFYHRTAHTDSEGDELGEEDSEEDESSDADDEVAEVLKYVFEPFMKSLCLSIEYEHVAMDLVRQLESGTSTTIFK
ncbi:hypothetical protein Tco_0037365, partial [Tanacetum coccineum]